MLTIISPDRFYFTFLHFVTVFDLFQLRFGKMIYIKIRKYRKINQLINKLSLRQQQLLFLRKHIMIAYRLRWWLLSWSISWSTCCISSSSTSPTSSSSPCPSCHVLTVNKNVFYIVDFLGSNKIIKPS